MKHILGSFVLVIFLFGVTGCFRSSDDQAGEEMTMETYTGVISVLPQATQNLFEASNGFETENGEIVYIRSLIYDLADPVYKNALLKIDGVPRVVNGKKTLTIDKIEVLEERSILTDLTFVDFEDDDFGIAMQIPDVLDVDVESSKLSLSGEVLEGDFVIERHDLLDESAYDQPTLDQFSEVEIGARGVTAFFDKNSVKGFHYVVYRQDFVYEITFSPEANVLETELALELLKNIDFIAVNKVDDSDDLETENENETEEEVEAASEESAPEISQVKPAEDVTNLSALDLSKFTKLESLPLEFSVYYPNSWYYAQVGKGYAFAKDPVEEGNWIAYVEVAKDDSVKIDAQWSSFKRTVSGRNFTVYGLKDNEKTLETILASLSVVKNN